jgi:hypothetical protein
VLKVGFGLWLRDNIAILSMVKRAYLLFLTGQSLCKVWEKLNKLNDLKIKRTTSQLWHKMEDKPIGFGQGG